MALNEDIDRVREILAAVVASMPEFMTDPGPTVVVTALGDYSNTIQLRAWLADESLHIGSRFQLREAAYKALLAAGVDMPLETLQLAPFKIQGSGTP